MTRINVIDPIELTDQHLMAEYRELPMVMGSLKRTLASKAGFNPKRVPAKFTLNSGHVYFFYNKGKFLERRYNALITELVRRGYSLDPNRDADFDVFKNNGLYNDWAPTNEAVMVNSERITERILDKVDWYKYYSRPIAESPLFLNLIAPTSIWV